MKMKHLLKDSRRLALFGLMGWALACPFSGQAATINVGVSNTNNALAFFPSTVTINAGDQVTWTWAGTSPHSTTSSTGAWTDTGLLTAPATFSHTFTSPGSFPYFCSLHAGRGMTGSITVQAGDVPPNVAITSPANGAIFAAPWTGAIQVTNSDSDGTVSTVDFFANATHLGTVTNPPANASFTVTDLPAGNYTLTAIATDNGGATNTSAGVNISVVTPGPIVLSAPERVSPSTVQFNYSANPGLSYVVLRSAALPTFLPISTNQATSSTVTNVDNSASGPVNFYRVQLAPNP
jgi:plastocyanin